MHLPLFSSISITNGNNAFSGGIFRNSGNLNIVLSGINSVDISGVADEAKACGVIACDGDVSITSTNDGSLAVVSAPSTDLSYGILSNNLTISDCTVTAKGNASASTPASAGITARYLVFTNATAIANGGNAQTSSCGIFNRDNADITNSYVTAKGVGVWALAAAKWSVGSGLVQGSGGKLNPTANITRAESATIILRLLQKAGLVDVRSKA